MTDPIPFTPAEVGIRTGLTAGDRIWRTVAFFDGVSETSHADTLARLAAVCEDHALAEIHRHTNCATSRRWAWALAGCAHPWCRMPDEQVRALDGAGPVSWDLKIAADMDALVTVTSTAQYLALLDEGWTIHFCGSPGSDHVETCGEKPDPTTGIAIHGGGGRSMNAITVGKGDVRSSLGRPPRHIIDPSKLIPELRKFDDQAREANLGETAPA